MLAWSAEEAGKVIETYKAYENKPPDNIMERSDSAPHQKVYLSLMQMNYVYKCFCFTNYLYNYCLVDWRIDYSQIGE